MIVYLNINYLLFFTFNFTRAIAAAANADASSQFNHVQTTINFVSANQAELRHAVKAIQNKDRLWDCKAYEEKEGRQNCDMLNRFIVIGGPYFDPGPELQQSLQDQVGCTSMAAPTPALAP
jgi:hypothetical protein